MEAAVAMFAAVAPETALSMGLATATSTATGAVIASSSTSMISGLVSTGAATLAPSAMVTSAASFISGAFSVGSALTSIGSANIQSAQLEEQAMLQDVQAKQSLLQGEREGLTALEAANAVAAKNIASGFASGLTGSGSVGRASEEAIAKGERESSIARDDALMQANVRKRQASITRTKASSAKDQGYIDAFTKVASFADRQVARGEV